jgi:hypothetical protein
VLGGEWRKNHLSKKETETGFTGLRGFTGMSSPSAKCQLPFELMAAEDFAVAGSPAS